MANTPSAFEGLKITTFYKYILYLAGVILIGSLFFDVKGIDVALVRRTALYSVIIGLFIWIFRDIIGDIAEFLYEDGKGKYHDERRLIGDLTALYTFHWIIIIIALCIGLWLVWGLI